MPARKTWGTFGLPPNLGSNRLPHEPGYHPGLLFLASRTALRSLAGEPGSGPAGVSVFYKPIQRHGISSENWIDSGMKLRKTYVDSGVLIAAFRGQGDPTARAMQILDDPTREFVSSIYVKLETLPKAIYHNAVCINVKLIRARLGSPTEKRL